MKFLISLLCAALFSGCATNNPQPVSPETGAAVVRVTVSIGATAVLHKNPKYIEATSALAAGVDVLLGDQTTKIDSATLSEWVRAVCKQQRVAPEDVPLFVSLVQSVTTLYQATYGNGPILSTDPKVKLYAAAFRDGLRDAVVALK